MKGLLGVLLRTSAGLRVFLVVSPGSEAASLSTGPFPFPYTRGLSLLVDATDLAPERGGTGRSYPLEYPATAKPGRGSAAQASELEGEADGTVLQELHD